MMGSYMNFKNSGETPQWEGSGGIKPLGSSPLARQSSIYSLTFDEFQNTLGGAGKDFGSMNMDELLKSIWTAEEIQSIATYGGVGEGSAPSGNLQRQGSLTLPRTLSQKTIGDIWRDLPKESNAAHDGSGSEGSHLQQRQPTLGEMTLEEFLVKAGVVREDAQPMGRPIGGGFYGNSPQPNNNGVLSMGFQQSPQNNIVLASQITQNLLPNNSSGLPVDVGGIRPAQQQAQQLFPKQVTVAFASSVPLMNNSQLGSPGTGGPIVRTRDASINNALLPGSVIPNALHGTAGLATGTTMIAAKSPASQISPEGIMKSDVGRQSISPPTYLFGGSMRGRKSSGTVEKAMERRLRRMIKNRESAARSRARKQAYTLELEAEIEKLKAINKQLQKKQEEILKMQKNKTVEKIRGSKRRSLRRTLTGPW